MPDGLSTWPTGSDGQAGFGVRNGSNFNYWQSNGHGHGGVTLYGADGNALAVDANKNLQVNTAPNSGLLQTAITVAATATALPSSALANRRNIAVFNGDTQPIYLGSATVTAGTSASTAGMDLPAGQSVALDMGPTVTLYAISTAGTAAHAVKVLEVA